MQPAVTTLRREVDAGTVLPVALRRAAEAAEVGMRATIPLQARKGRASYLGERSIGHQDPGATSTALIVRALERTVAGSQ
jgi:dihydroxyacetone kinase-like protein